MWLREIKFTHRALVSGVLLVPNCKSGKSQSCAVRWAAWTYADMGMGHLSVIETILLLHGAAEISVLHGESWLPVSLPELPPVHLPQN